MWLLEEVVSRLVKLSEPLPMDPWYQLGGDLFKRGRIEGVYDWEESCPAAASCPYFEIGISVML